jgi:hypothetical protein
LLFKSSGSHFSGQHMHPILLLVGRVVHVSFHSSFVPKVIPWKKIMVKFGLLELQVGFKSCTEYFCKENEKGSTQFLKHLLKIIWLYNKLEKCNNYLRRLSLTKKNNNRWIGEYQIYLAWLTNEDHSHVSQISKFQNIVQWVNIVT